MCANVRVRWWYYHHDTGENVMSELALEDAPDFPAAAHEAAGGQVVYITENGRRLAAIVPAELAEDIADATAARAARTSVEEGEALVSWEQVKAEAGL
jgi:antitoxin Phd